MRTIVNKFNGKVLEIFKKSPYNDGTTPPSNSHVFVRQQGSKSYSFFRGSYCSLKDLEYIQ